MALVPCWECGREISDKAAACPHCGAPARAPEWKMPEYFCPNCEQEIVGTAEICPECGASIASGTGWRPMPISMLDDVEAQPASYASTLKTGPLKLLVLDDFPAEIAVTKVDGVIPGGAFFLDFARPIEPVRMLAIGPVKGWLVPIVHQGEKAGGFVISVSRGEPYFLDIPKLWKERHPERRLAPANEIGGLEIAADFATQFPGDCLPTT